FHAAPPPHLYSLSLHDALPIFVVVFTDSGQRVTAVQLLAVQPERQMTATQTGAHFVLGSVGVSAAVPDDHPTGAILPVWVAVIRSEEHTSELQSLTNLVCRLLL